MFMYMYVFTNKLTLWIFTLFVGDVSMFATGSCDATSRVWRYREGAWQGNALVMDPQEIAK